MPGAPKRSQKPYSAGSRNPCREESSALARLGFHAKRLQLYACKRCVLCGECVNEDDRLGRLRCRMRCQEASTECEASSGSCAVGRRDVKPFVSRARLLRGPSIHPFTPSSPHPHPSFTPSSTPSSKLLAQAATASQTKNPLSRPTAPSSSRQTHFQAPVSPPPPRPPTTAHRDGRSFALAAAARRHTAWLHPRLPEGRRKLLRSTLGGLR